MKLVIKLLIVAVAANAGWHLMTAYMSFYKFKDAVEQAAQFGVQLPDDMLRQKVLALGTEYDVPIDEDNFSVRREGGHLYLTGKYAKPVDLLPGMHYPWTFSWNAEAMDLTPKK